MSTAATYTIEPDALGDDAVLVRRHLVWADTATSNAVASSRLAIVGGGHPETRAGVSGSAVRADDVEPCSWARVGLRGGWHVGGVWFGFVGGDDEGGQGDGGDETEERCERAPLSPQLMISDHFGRESELPPSPRAARPGQAQIGVR